MTRAVALLLVTACASLRTDRALERVQGIVREAEQQARAGDAAGAIEAVRAELPDAAPGTEQEQLLKFTLGWLHSVLAEQCPDEEVIHLQEAVVWYQRVLDLAPGQLAASQNLATVHAQLAERKGDPSHLLTAVRVLEDALAAGQATREEEYGLWVDIGSLHATRGDREAALQALDQAYERSPEEVLAPRGIVEELADWDAGQERLAAYCERFAAHPATWDPAQDGFLALVQRRGAAAPAALERWLDLAARRKSFDAADVARLPTPSPAPGGGELDLALRELGLVVEDPLTEALDYWIRTPARRQLTARALRVLAEARRPRAGQEAGVGSGEEATAEEILKRAYALAPTAEESLEQGLPDLRLDLALDLAFLYHAHAEQTDPDRTRFKGLFQESAWLSLETYRSVERPLEQRSKYLGLIGVMFQERGIWGDEPEDLRLAVEYLRAAIDLEPEPRPSLSRKLGDVLAKQGRAIQAMDAYQEAARGFLDHGAVRLAREVLPVARPFARETRSTLRRQQHDLEDLLYPRHGFYVGLSGGLTDGHENGGRLASDLLAQSHLTRVSIDDSDFGWKAFVGYRPETELPILGEHYQLPWAVELGYVSLEGHSSQIQILSTPSVQSLRQAIESEHPLTGRGASLALQAFPWERGDLSATAKVGGWWWKSDLDVSLAGGSIRVDETGLDLMMGAGLQYRITWRVSARAEFERYLLDGDPVDLISLGLQLRF